MIDMWTFISDQLFKMKWLSDAFMSLLKWLGMDTQAPLTQGIHFFLYDTVKICILLCVLICLVSFIQSYFPPERSKVIIGRFHGLWANLIGALLGTVTPFCSCSSIPLFIGFTSAGLPLGATFSFLISSPMVDLGSLILLSSIFGFKIASIYVLAGLVLAVIGGSFIEHMHMEQEVESFAFSAKVHDYKDKKISLQERSEYAVEQVKSTLKKVFPYILVGVAIGSFIHNVIPAAWIEKALGNRNPFGVLLATILGVPIYADIFGTIPVAEALLYKGAQLGTILAFMMAVTTLSFPSLIMLKKVLKPRLWTLFILICVIGIALIGYLFNILQPLLV